MTDSPVDGVEVDTSMDDDQANIDLDAWANSCWEVWYGILFSYQFFCESILLY